MDCIFYWRAAVRLPIELRRAARLYISSHMTFNHVIFDHVFPGDCASGFIQASTLCISTTLLWNRSGDVLLTFTLGQCAAIPCAHVPILRSTAVFSNITVLRLSP